MTVLNILQNHTELGKKGNIMKNFVLGFLTCLCLGFAFIQLYLVFCPEARRLSDTYITNQMILPYNGFVLKPIRTSPVFPYNDFPFILQEKDESIKKNKTILPKFEE